MVSRLVHFFSSIRPILFEHFSSQYFDISTTHTTLDPIHHWWTDLSVSTDHAQALALTWWSGMLSSSDVARALPSTFHFYSGSGWPTYLPTYFVAISTMDSRAMNVGPDDTSAISACNNNRGYARHDRVSSWLSQMYPVFLAAAAVLLILHFFSLFFLLSIISLFLVFLFMHGGELGLCISESLACIID